MAIPHPYKDLVSSLDEDVARFFGWSVDEVRERTKTSREERNRRWVEADPKTEEDRNALYSSLGELDLLKYAAWHQDDEEKMAIHDRAVAEARKTGGVVLDCGGGIGDTTLVFAANGVYVVYVDFPGVCSDFARSRWERFGCLERVRPMTPEEFWEAPPEGFSLAASIDVLEHLENPVAHASRYRELLTPGGHLFVTAHFVHNAQNPDHLPRNNAYHRVFGGEPKTAKRCVLTNLGFTRRKWFWYTRD
ncbi:MAG TPA: methyltransferase domain-containing protein [Planctomycetes bacterium]|nr:methyltransferase domain-containing protein [Planctomycetota bacterium]